jgi:hypothetical protein
MLANHKCATYPLGSVLMHANFMPVSLELSADNST